MFEINVIQCVSDAVDFIADNLFSVSFSDTSKSRCKAARQTATLLDEVNRLVNVVRSMPSR